jgi:Protein of unknown function (DUF1616)
MSYPDHSVRQNVDVVITATVAVLACAASAFGVPVAVTAILGMALFASPGYLFAQVLFGSQVAGVERTTVAIALAFCVPIFGGLLLYVAGVPLHRLAWLGLLAGVTLVGDILLLWRRRGGLTEQRTRAPIWRQWPPRHLAAFGAAVLIAVGAVGLARAGAAMQQYSGFTQLWLVHRNNSFSTANLGVGNYEGRTMHYRLVLLRDGRSTATWSITLGQGQAWHRSPAFSGGYHTLAADLYRLPDTAHVYRHVTIYSDGQPRS